MFSKYFEAIQLVERLHRHFLEVLKVELDKHHLEDINNIQGLILYNIGTDNLTIGELTVRGYYLGSNVSYNIKKMVEHDYLIQEQSVHDKRSVRVRLSEKGLKIRNLIDAMITRHEKTLDGRGMNEESFKNLNESLKKLEKFWAGEISLNTMPNLYS
jgi:DNA-binding MarR family transcriptional regulator